MKENHQANRNQNYFAVFGNTVIPKGYCANCQSESLIQDGKFLCCGSEAGKISDTFKSICEAEAKRQTPNRFKKKEILESQNYRCLFCGKSFGSFVKRNNKPIKLLVNWDHFIPYSFGYNNKDENFVASCQICNSLKSDFVFDSIEEAQIYLQTKRIEKGYRYEMLELPIKFSNDEDESEVLLKPMSGDVLQNNDQPDIQRSLDGQRGLGKIKNQPINGKNKNKKRGNPNPQKVRENPHSQETNPKPLTNFKIFLQKYGFSLGSFCETLKKYGVDSVSIPSAFRLTAGQIATMSPKYLEEIKPQIKNACYQFLMSIGKTKSEAESELNHLFSLEGIKAITQTIIIPEKTSANYVFKDHKGRTLSVIVFQNK